MKKIQREIRLFMNNVKSHPTINKTENKKVICFPSSTISNFSLKYEKRHQMRVQEAVKRQFAKNARLQRESRSGNIYRSRYLMLP